MTKNLALTTTDGHSLIVEVHSGYVNMWLTLKDGSTNLPIRLSTGASLELREALHLGMK